MAGSPASPTPSSPQSYSSQSRPMSAVLRPARSSSRMSISSRPGGSRASDDDARTSVKVGMFWQHSIYPFFESRFVCNCLFKCREKH